MSTIPIIIAQGGISPAGRTSGFSGFKRLIFDRLSNQEQHKYLLELANLTNNHHKSTDELLGGTLIRELDSQQKKSKGYTTISLPSKQKITVTKRQLQSIKEQYPTELIEEIEQNDNNVKISFNSPQKLMLPNDYEHKVGSAGLLPSGFEPEKLYNSHNHPRNLSMTLFAISDALYSSGLCWETVLKHLSPDDIAVYAGSAMSQLDHLGFGGLLQARLTGKRPTSKQCPLGFSQMTTDFINAYVINGMGGAGASLGACASFLYNLSWAVTEIKTGKRKVVIVGGSEAPIIPEIIEGYANMSALATIDGLRAIDNLTASQAIDFSRSCRPFGNGCGFTLGESSQFIILMDDQLAMELGAQSLGAVADVFINADGNKRSITSPGIGNFFTMSKAAALAQAIAGQSNLQECSFVQAHGTGTPQNRVTESQILNEVARHFKISNWNISAIKGYLGHSLGTAGGDQIMGALGSWETGIIPGILTTHTLANDIYQDQLNILLTHLEFDSKNSQIAIINSKGFGGNNASAVLLSPFLTKKLLHQKHGEKAITSWKFKKEHTDQLQAQYFQNALTKPYKPIYRFGEQTLTIEDLTWGEESLKIPEYGYPLNLKMDNPFDYK